MPPTKDAAKRPVKLHRNRIANAHPRVVQEANQRTDVIAGWNVHGSKTKPHVAFAVSEDRPHVFHRPALRVGLRWLDPPYTPLVRPVVRQPQLASRSPDDQDFGPSPGDSEQTLAGLGEVQQVAIESRVMQLVQVEWFCSPTLEAAHRQAVIPMRPIGDLAKCSILFHNF